MKKLALLTTTFLLLFSSLIDLSYAAGKPSASPQPKPTAASNSSNSSKSETSSNAADVNNNSKSTSSNGNSSGAGTSNNGQGVGSSTNNAGNANQNAQTHANSNSAVAKADSNKVEEDNGPTNRYIIRYGSSTDLSTEIKSLTDKKVKVDRTFSKIFKGAVANLTEKQVTALRKNPNTAEIELDSTVSTSDFQNTSSWGLDRIDQRNLPLDSGFTYNASGTNSKIYVVDTGIRSSHAELSGRVLSGYTSITDGQGTNDCNGHGTHVSGIAAGVNVGVAKSALLVPVRVLDCTGSGSISGVIAGLDWIAGVYVTGTPAVVNMSLGGGASSSLDTAVNNLIAKGIAVVVAAGNSSSDACFSSPSRVSAAITVGASNSNDSYASYSNYGSCVDIISPGTGIYSSWNSSDSSYANLSGTSMATPYVSGYIAVVESLGYQSPSSIFSTLMSNATLNVISGVNGSTPNALLYTSANMASPSPTPSPVISAPSAPSNLIAVAGKRSASLSWTSADTNGSPITGQVLKIYSQGILISTKSVQATANSLTVLNLNYRKSYSFTITAKNAAGTGPESVKSNEITPLK